jgi:TolB-like protein/Flp pilus assembly protein TadD
MNLTRRWPSNLMGALDLWLLLYSRVLTSRPGVMSAPQDLCVRFGPFELDVRSGDLKKQGRRIPLQDQPLLVLQVLLEGPGELVTREELRGRLWPDGTFVDFDDGLNTAVMRLREALGDVAKRPRYVETQPRRGYRFIAPIERAASSRVTSIRSVAVLPLDNLSGDADDEVFADAMTDELITSLAKASSLRVISRGSVMQFKRSRAPLPEIGRALGVDALVEGTVIRAGHRVRVTAQLIEAAADRHLWADSYEGELRDILTLQRGMAVAIAGEVSAHLSARQRAAVAGAPAPARVNPDAYLAYIKGRACWDQRNEGALLRGITAFHQAIDIDARYAAAYAGLADCYTALGYGSYLAPRAAFEHAAAAAAKALAIDAGLAGAEAALAYVALYHHWDAAEADRRFRRAIALAPALVTAHHWYAVFLTAIGRFDDARAAIHRACALDPLSHAVNTDVGFVDYYSERYDDAIANLITVLRVAPAFPLAHLWLGRAYQEQGRLDDAIHEFTETRRIGGDWPVALAALGHVLGVSGRASDARRVLDQLEQLSRRQYVTEYGVALVHAGLGDHDAAFEWLNRAVAARAHWLVWLKLDPRWKALRDDQRFADLLGRVGLTP